ncbi:hypothetical protein CFP56_023122 [Quercus suber]|uniref:PGG domain-containing protein n=1 Tax=Quercus suber TaxID=58331 RepID=A0AAW0M0V7_QUESU
MASCIQLGEPKKSKSWFKHFQYNPKKDRAGDVRNILLIVATLIAAVTFQAGVNPPGGVWQDYTIRNRTLCAEKRAQGIGPDPSCYKSHVPGTAIYASQRDPFYVFLVFNTVALSTSVLVIMSLTYNFPFHLELFIAAASMLCPFKLGLILLAGFGKVMTMDIEQREPFMHLKKKPSMFFLIPNALALSALVLVIMSLTCTDARRFPFDQFEIFVATASMILTYGSAIFAVKPKESVRFNYILLAAAGPFVMRYLIKKFKRIKSGSVNF